MILRNVAAAILRSLRAMDEQATGCGLRFWGQYVGNLGQTEREWADQLVSMLRRLGFPSEAGRTYPGANTGGCDLVITLASGETIWIEMKDAFKTYYLESRNRRYLTNYYSRFFYQRPRFQMPPFSVQPNSALYDLEKLSRLRPPTATHAGL